MKEYEYVRAAGGFLIHVVKVGGTGSVGSYRAICGHQPRSKGVSRMAPRARWLIATGPATCTGCKAFAIATGIEK